MDWLDIVVRSSSCIADPLWYHSMYRVGNPKAEHVNCKISVLVTFVSIRISDMTGATAEIKHGS